MVEKKEGEAQPKKEMPKVSKKEEWELVEIPTQTELALKKGEEIIPLHEAARRTLNNTEKILKIVGGA